MDRHRRPDGTYDGVGVMSELSGISREEVLAISERVKANSAVLNGCAYHEFEPVPPLAPIRQRYRCRRCGGEVDALAYYWHELGRRPRDGA